MKNGQEGEAKGTSSSPFHGEIEFEYDARDAAVLGEQIHLKPMVQKQDMTDLSSLFGTLSLEKTVVAPSHTVEVTFDGTPPRAMEIKAHLLTALKIHASTYSIIQLDTETSRATLVFNTIASAVSFMDATNGSLVNDDIDDPMVPTKVNTDDKKAPGIKFVSGTEIDSEERISEKLRKPLPRSSTFFKSARYVNKIDKPAAPKRTSSVALRMIRHALAAHPK